jgi:acetolactate decarboxylase
MRQICVVFLLLSISARAQSDIVVFGALADIMQKGDLSVKIILDTVRISNTTYALGVASSLEGEIVIIEGRCLRSYIENGKVITIQESDTKAAMLVRSDIESFTHSETMSANTSIKDLEQQLKSQGEKLFNGMPFAFLIKAKIEKVDYHIIDWRENSEHTPANHKQFAQRGSFVNEDVIIVGFYSENHQGVFTPHSTKVHMHVYNPSKNIVGHVDGISSVENIKILFP